jgi:hypothetical protein
LKSKTLGIRHQINGAESKIIFKDTRLREIKK